MTKYLIKACPVPKCCLKSVVLDLKPDSSYVEGFEALIFNSRFSHEGRIENAYSLLICQVFLITDLYPTVICVSKVMACLKT